MDLKVDIKIRPYTYIIIIIKCLLQRCVQKELIRALNVLKNLWDWFIIFCNSNVYRISNHILSRVRAREEKARFRTPIIVATINTLQ